ncbi:MAG: GAF domain-containing protein [Spirulinaceae cyanobacterium RM2_2_10]|nr:GAF domain-containing protein [Spirulinaceae cyanobacterium SM2_1_0]NJO20759.1 GAF domain-containing protein [Spirulinaceae cyanobacterium RM2_2_10]
MKFFDAPGFGFDHEEFSTSAAERVALIEQLLSIGNALSGTQDLGQLLELILAKSREITASDAGSVFLIDRRTAPARLIFKIAQNDSLQETAFIESFLPINPKSLAGYVALTGRSLNIPDAQSLPADLPYQLDRTFDRDFRYRTRSVLVLPMQDGNGELIGVLQLLNRKRKEFAHTNVTPKNATEIVQPYTDWEERIVRSLASQAAISIERNQLQESIESLFEGFVRASVQVIESRDPTTSGHSERVAALTVRLAEEASTIEQGPLRLLYFSPRQIQEIRYASLLHDFGKVGVTEAILNKRQKLYPEQLNLIRQRFATAQRTLELECAQEKFKHLVTHPAHLQHHAPGADETCPHCQSLQKYDRHMARAVEQLRGRLSLIEAMNEPEALEIERFEAFSEEAMAELTALAQDTYVDTDGQCKPLVSPTELEQLLVPRGNLTREERLAIEAHVTYSYEFLKRIPWTSDFQEIPNIAYGHHEKLDGTGYPRGLRGDEIPVQTQMMAIADIYDALTAADRPYKHPLPIDIVLRILYEEADKQRINADLLHLFIDRQVYQVLGRSF